MPRSAQAIQAGTEVCTRGNVLLDPGVNLPDHHKAGRNTPVRSRTHRRLLPCGWNLRRSDRWACTAAGGTCQGNDAACAPNQCPQRGDLNCDGVVNVADIPHFVQALVDPAGYDADHDGTPYSVCQRSRADMNQDTFEDGLDVQPFVNTLLAP
jgi:hypothetical protein